MWNTEMSGSKMSQDFYNCAVCGEIFGDYSDYQSCEKGHMLCGSCGDSCLEELEEILSEENKADMNCDEIVEALMEELDELPENVCTACFHEKIDAEPKPNEHGYLLMKFRSLRNTLKQKWALNAHFYKSEENCVESFRDSVFAPKVHYEIDAVYCLTNRTFIRQNVSHIDKKIKSYSLDSDGICKLEFE